MAGSVISGIDVFTIRHARSAGQDNPPLYGVYGDFPLPVSEAGRQQAKDAGAFLEGHFRRHPEDGKRVAILSSPYKRAVETLGLYLPSISAQVAEIKLKPYLGEHRYGIANGLSEEELAEKYPAFVRQRAAAEAAGHRHRLAFPGTDKDGVQGESQYDVWTRTQAVIADIKAAQAEGVTTVIVNTHGTAGRAVQMHLLGIQSSDDIWRAWKKPHNCQIDLIRDGKAGPVYVPDMAPGERTPAPYAPSRHFAVQEARL